MTLNQTHDPARLSWVETANDAATDFPLQNLPYGVFRPGPVATPRIGVAIGTSILDLAAAAHIGLLPEIAAAACRQTSLNELMSLGAPAWSALRARLSELLGADTCPAGPLRTRVESCLTPMAGTEMLLPAHIGDYTDFYASISTPPTSARCSAPTIRCSQITSGCPSVTTAAARPSSSAAPPCAARTDN